MNMTRPQPTKKYVENLTTEELSIELGRLKAQGLPPQVLAVYEGELAKRKAVRAAEDSER